jgi:Zn-finger nucleic acid-binding protein
VLRRGVKSRPLGATVTRSPRLAARVKACPACHAPREAPLCPRCGALWLAHEAEGPLRRLLGKGPLAQRQCPDCGGALKALDVPGEAHEGDLFWGLESPRPAGSALAEGCPRCGGVFVDEANLQRAGGVLSFRASLTRVARDAS